MCLNTVLHVLVQCNISCFRELGFQVTVFVSNSRCVLVKCCKDTKTDKHIRIVKLKVGFQVCFQLLHSNISCITSAGKLLLMRELLVTLRGSPELIITEELSAESL